MNGHPITLRELARLAETSASTVSRVLSRDPRISEATRLRVQAVLKQHPYRPNSFARALKGGRTGLVGVLSSSIGSGFYAEVLQGIDGISRQHNTHLMCSFAHGIRDYHQMAYDMLSGRRVDALILIAPPMELLESKLPAHSVPVVLCAAHPTHADPTWQQVDSVTVDNAHALHQLVDHLAPKGPRRWIHLAGPVNTYDGRSRLAAFEDAMSEHPGQSVEILNGHLIEVDGFRSAQEILHREEPPPDTWICFNDSTALGVLRALDHAGLQPGIRQAVSGWDNEPVCPHLQLTSVEMPMNELGRQSALLLYERLGSSQSIAPVPRHIQLQAKVHFRGSTGDAHPALSTPAGFE